MRMAGKFPRLPLLRKPLTWAEWFVDTACLIPVLFVLIFVFGFSAGMMVAVSVAVQGGAAWRISQLGAAKNEEIDQND